MEFLSEEVSLTTKSPGAPLTRGLARLKADPVLTPSHSSARSLEAQRERICYMYEKKRRVILKLYNATVQEGRHALHA